jgi:senataxin
LSFPRPPGTGKTKTIVGLIGAFVASRPPPSSSVSVGKRSTGEAVAPVAKVLLCAPSNAAVDEVAKRLKDGIRGADGQLFIPKVVRIGSDSAVDISVKDIFIDELVERELNGTSSNNDSNSTSAQAKMYAMRSEVDILRGERDGKKLELDNIVENDARKSELLGQLRMIKSRIFTLSQQLDSEKDKAQQSKRAMDAQQRKIRFKILSEADVICATLSGSGHDYMAQVPFDFETVIIDEAAQSVELSSLIPLKYGCQRCILVGGETILHHL